jgi:hypothetical protein
MNQLKLRASQFPILDKCQGMLSEPECLRIGNISDVATMGTDAHRECAKFVKSDEAPDFKMLNDDIRIPVSIAWDMWDRSLGTLDDVEYPALRGFFPDPQVEQELRIEYVSNGPRELPIVTGHPDLYGFSVVGDSDSDIYDLNVLDWKAGYLIKDYLPQLIAYAELVTNKYPGVQIRNVNLINAYVRKDKGQRFVSYRMTRAEAILAYDKIIRKVLNYDGESFTTGEHCQYCPLRSYGCDAYNRTISSALVSLDRTEGHDLFISKPISTYRWLGEIIRQANAIKAHIKADVADGIIYQEDGQELYMAESNDKVESDEAIDHLLLEYSHEAILDQCKISKGGIQQLAKDAAPRGEKGTAAKQIVEDLREKGIITKSGDGTLKTRKIKTEVK